MVHAAVVVYNTLRPTHKRASQPHTALRSLLHTSSLGMATDNVHHGLTLVWVDQSSCLAPAHTPRLLTHGSVRVRELWTAIGCFFWWVKRGCGAYIPTRRGRRRERGRRPHRHGAARRGPRRWVRLGIYPLCVSFVYPVLAGELAFNKAIDSCDHFLR